MVRSRVHRKILGVIPARYASTRFPGKSLANIDSRNVVQVFSSDRSTLYATILTIDADRPEATDKTAITFAERGMQPETIVLWFYPGSSFGHQFLYSKPEEQELARAKQRTVTTG